MSDLTDVCTLCNAGITAAFTAPPRQPPVVISSDLHVPGPCFVADQIEFLDTGKLIFDIPLGQPQQEYAVVCRKLIVNGGATPSKGDPCNPGDPGTRYNNTNVITWSGRLTSAAPGGTFTPPGASSSTAEDGNQGKDGATGNAGSAGANLIGFRGDKRTPVKLVVLALEVEILNGGNLAIDWAGQDGGDGGKGQNGGKGDKGTKGPDGTQGGWPGYGCDNQPGDGGQGGDGGAGGMGGPGGAGGAGGQIAIISTPANLAGPFNNPNQIVFVTQSSGGKGGAGGTGAGGGLGGNPGKQGSSDCTQAGSGNPGDAGDPGPVGGGGSPGSALTPTLEPVTPAACATLIPIPLQFDASNVLPQVVNRCFSGSGTGEVVLTGQDLDQVTSVACSLSGVTAAIKNSSTDTELDLAISIAANSVSGVGDLIFTNSVGATQTLAGAIQVQLCQATAINPNSGTHGTTVNVTITGTAFDPTAASHDVNVSGLSVNAVNIAVVDDQHMTCQFIIDSAAAKTVRDVTIKAGLCSHTLVQSFTIN